MIAAPLKGTVEFALMRHSPNLDILRSVAVSAVLADHLILTLHAPLDSARVTAGTNFVTLLGHAGVLAFFVHTSLVLMYSLERMHAVLDRVAVRFYVRRIFRIYPLAIVAVLLALVCHIPSNTWWPDKVAVTPAVVAVNLLLMQNIHHYGSVLDPMWSLPYEVQMYLMLPGLYLLAAKKKGALYISIAFLAGCLLWFGVSLFGLAEYIPCFMAGVLGYTLRDRIRPMLSSFIWIPFLLVLTSEFCSLCAGQHEHSLGATVAGWAFCLALGLSIAAFHDVRNTQVRFVAAKLAQYSYGIYLLHVPLLYFVFEYLHLGRTIFSAMLFVVLTIGVSILAFHGIESPLINLGRKLSSPGDKPVPRYDPVAPAP